jgi:putative peptidoglycan lipid II flippase
MDWGLRLTIFICAPAAVGLITLSMPLLTTLFFGGKFGAHDVEMSQMSLIAYSFGLLGFVLVKILAPGFYARQNTKTPVKIGMVAIGANIVSNIFIVIPMYLNNVPGAHMGLAISTSLSAFVNSGLLFYFLRKHNIYTPQPGWWMLIVRVLIACGAMAWAILYFSPELATWIQWTRLERVVQVGFLVILGMAVYFATLIALGIKLKSLLKLV